MSDTSSGLPKLQRFLVKTEDTTERLIIATSHTIAAIIFAEIYLDVRMAAIYVRQEDATTVFRFELTENSNNTLTFTVIQ